MNLEESNKKYVRENVPDHQQGSFFDFFVTIDDHHLFHQWSTSRTVEVLLQLSRWFSSSKIVLRKKLWFRLKIRFQFHHKKMILKVLVMHPLTEKVKLLYKNLWEVHQQGKKNLLSTFLKILKTIFWNRLWKKSLIHRKIGTTSKITFGLTLKSAKELIRRKRFSIKILLKILIAASYPLKRKKSQRKKPLPKATNLKEKSNSQKLLQPLLHNPWRCN